MYVHIHTNIYLECFRLVLSMKFFVSCLAKKSLQVVIHTYTHTYTYRVREREEDSHKNNAFF